MNKYVALFFGDSLTAGTLGIGYTRYIQPPPAIEPRYRGINGDTMLGVTMRAGKYLDRLGKKGSGEEVPKAVIIECGANDLLLPYISVTGGPEWAEAAAMLVKPGREPVSSFDSFISIYRDKLENLARLVSRNWEPQPALAIMTIPLLGEETGSELNRSRKELNNRICHLCSQLELDILNPAGPLEDYISPMSTVYGKDNAKLYPTLEGASALGSITGRDGKVSFFPDSETPDLFQRDAAIVGGDPQKADVLSRQRGLAVTIDGLHFNSIGARITAQAVNRYLRQLHA